MIRRHQDSGRPPAPARNPGSGSSGSCAGGFGGGVLGQGAAHFHARNSWAEQRSRQSLLYREFRLSTTCPPRQLGLEPSAHQVQEQALRGLTRGCPRIPGCRHRQRRWPAPRHRLPQGPARSDVARRLAGVTGIGVHQMPFVSAGQIHADSPPESSGRRAGSSLGARTPRWGSHRDRPESPVGVGGGRIVDLFFSETPRGAPLVSFLSCSDLW